MTLPSSTSSPPKRPRLSLQIKPPATVQTFSKSATALRADIDPSSPTAFNTLSNAYAAAIENASPRTARSSSLPLSASEVKPRPISLRLQTKLDAKDGYVHPSQRTQTPGPFSITYPDTPSSAITNPTPTTSYPESQPVTSASATAAAAATSFTCTPPQSAGPDNPMRVFTFAANTDPTSPNSPRTPRRRVTLGSLYQAPYTHPRSLHSILRNSPLPPRSTITPATPTRVSMRLALQKNKKVGYNDPLTQTIITNKYVKSHIDLLSEDSPHSATDPEAEKLGNLDLTMKYTGDETRDGGQTPGPFEEMRRRMADHDLETPGSKKRKRKEKKRKWEWTITAPEDGSPNGDGDKDEDKRPTKTPVTAVKIEKTPNTAIWRGVSVSTTDDSEAEDFGQVSVDTASEDSEMSDRDAFRAVSVSEMDLLETVERPQTSQSL